MGRELRLGLPIAGNLFDIMNSMGGPVITHSNLVLVPSPCVGYCRIDNGTGLCEGCARTLDEIAGWMSMGEDGRQAVMDRVGVVFTENQMQ
jgi:predicted Fe-S protein YdhL (DUF1289 family)